MGKSTKYDYDEIMTLNNLSKELEYFYPDDKSEVMSAVSEISEKIDGENLRIGRNNDGEEFIGQHSVEQTFYRDGDRFFRKDIDRNTAPNGGQHPRWNAISSRAKEQIFHVLDRCRELSRPMTFFAELYGPGCNGRGMKWRQDGLDLLFFDIRDGDEYVHPDDISRYIDDIDIDWVPILGRMTVSEALAMDIEHIPSRVAESGYMEGVVIKPLTRPTGWKTDKRLIIKYKRAERAEKRDVSESDKKTFHSEFIQYVTPERIEKAIQHATMDNVTLSGDKSDIGRLIPYIISDIEKEENNGEPMSVDDKRSVSKYAGREGSVYFDTLAKENLRNRVGS